MTHNVENPEICSWLHQFMCYKNNNIASQLEKTLIGIVIKIIMYRQKKNVSITTVRDKGKGLLQQNDKTKSPALSVKSIKKWMSLTTMPQCYFKEKVEKTFPTFLQWFAKYSRTTFFSWDKVQSCCSHQSLIRTVREFLSSVFFLKVMHW